MSTDGRTSEHTIISLSNSLLTADWRLFGTGKGGISLDLITAERGKGIVGGPATLGRVDSDTDSNVIGGRGRQPVYTVILGDGRQVHPTAGRVVEGPSIISLQPDGAGRRPAARLAGRGATARVRHDGLANSSFDVVWTVTLRDGANYLRQAVSVVPAPGGAALPVYKLVLFEGSLPGRIGKVSSNDPLQGDVAYSADWFLGYEDPTAWNGGGDASHVLGVHPAAALGGVRAAGAPREAVFDVTRLWQAGHVHHPYLDNWHSTAVVHIDGVQLLSADGRVLTSDIRPGTASKTDTRGNIYTLDVPSARGVSATNVDYEGGDGGNGGDRTDTDGAGDERYRLKFMYHIDTPDHDAAVTFGLNIKGRPERVTCSFLVDAAIAAPLNGSLVIGAVTVPGQQRRAFLHYIEMERARASQINLHYNSWYDLATGDLLENAAIVATVHTIGRELVSKRGVQLDSFLMDDGWDDRKTVWEFHDSFPRGFADVQAAAGLYGASIGVWLSPWGGYYGRDDRVDAAVAQGMRVTAVGEERFLTFSCEKYLARFRAVTKAMLTGHGANLLKLDGLGTHHGGGARRQDAAHEYEVAKELLQEFRDAALVDDLFINLSTGTWPSPFWLLHADTVWRRGHDHYFAGQGPPRERWITYRDGMTYQNVVRVAPLFPLSSVMLHGVIYAKSAW